jgi:rRNA maturation endonuclease Nob1
MQERFAKLVEGRKNSKYHKNYIAIHIVEAFVKSEIDLAIKEERRRVVEKCQEEMYEALEEVAQYEGDLVNKHDIKVWIKALKNKEQLL